MTTKLFDAAEMMREGARHVAALLAGKTREEELAFWAEQNEAYRHSVDEAKVAAGSNPRWPLPPVQWPPQKDFDAVEMMHECQRRVEALLSGKTPEEKLAFWQAESERLKLEAMERAARSGERAP